jgi:hypothetical protein
MSQKGIREDRKKIDEALLNKKVNLAVGLNFPAMPRYLNYLEQSGVTDNLADTKANKERRCWEHMEVFPLLYLCKFLAGIKSTRGTKELLSNEAALVLLGFTDKEIKKGLTDRGKANQYGDGYERRSEIVAETTILDNICAYDYKDIIEDFDKYIKLLSKSSLIELGDIYILDSTIVETPANYPGAGKTKRQEEQDDGTVIEKIIYGFKVFVLMDSKTKVPVAIEITSAEKSDCDYLKRMVEKGIKNVGLDTIKTVVADRGFIDGKQMWEIKHILGIDFVIPARKNMDIWNDVVGLRKDYESKVVTWDYGKKGKAGGYIVNGAVSYYQFSETGDKNKEDGSPLNAVVVTMWGDKTIGPGKEKVFLTTLETKDAVKVMKSYRARSLIENCGFREMKQAAGLALLPHRKGEKAEIGAYMHMTLCVFAMATFIGFLIWDQERARKAKEEYRERSGNLREYRVEERSSNGYVFVFFEDAYTIYEIVEYSMKLGLQFVPR